MAEEKVILQAGQLCTGKSYEIVKSAKSAVDPGPHTVLTVLKENDVICDHDDLSYTEKGECCSIMQQFLNCRNQGRWMMGLNGKKVTTRPTFHIHGIVLGGIPGGPGQILRLVFNPREFLEALKTAAVQKDWAAVTELIASFEANLK